MTDERERRKSSGIGNGPRKSPILHFYAISIPTEPVPSSSKLVVRVFTTNYIRIVNAFGGDPSGPFSSWKYMYIHYVKIPYSVMESKYRKRGEEEREKYIIIMVTSNISQRLREWEHELRRHKLSLCEIEDRASFCWIPSVFDVAQF